MNIDKHLDASQKRRMAAEHRYLTRLEKREGEASKMIGELSTGKFYVWPVGGKYREGTERELIDFLLRNKYA